MGLVEDGVLVESETYTPNAEMRTTDLSWISTYMTGWLGSRQPDYVFIETPIIGNNRKYSMQISEVYGAVLAACGLWQSVGGEEPVVVIGVNNSEWKRQLIGKMPRTSVEVKKVVRRYLEELDSTYAVVCDGDQDRVDASCIALYGQLIYDRADDLVNPG